MAGKKWMRFVKIRCPKCGYINLIPVYEVFRILEPIHCDKCGELVAEPEEKREE